MVIHLLLLLIILIVAQNQDLLLKKIKYESLLFFINEKNSLGCSSSNKLLILCFGCVYVNIGILSSNPELWKEKSECNNNDYQVK